MCVSAMRTRKYQHQIPPGSMREEGRFWVAFEGHMGVLQRNKRGVVIPERGESTG